MDLYCNVLSGVIPPDTDDRHWLESGGYTFESVFSTLHHTWHYTEMDFANLTIPRQQDRAVYCKLHSWLTALDICVLQDLEMGGYKSERMILLPRHMSHCNWCVAISTNHHQPGMVLCYKFHSGSILLYTVGRHDQGVGLNTS